MAVTGKQQMILSYQHPLLFVLILFFSPFSYSQSFSPQNLETFYPFLIPTQPHSPSPSPSPSYIPPIETNLTPPPISPPPTDNSSTSKAVAKAVVATAASTFAAAVLLFFLVQRYLIARRKKKVGSDHLDGRTDHPNNFEAVGDNDRVIPGNHGKVKGYIVDENGLDVVYWRRLEEISNGKSLDKEFYNSPKGEDKEEEEKAYRLRSNRKNKSEPIQEVPLLRGKSSASHVKVEPQIQVQDGSTILSSDSSFSFGAIKKPNLPSDPPPPPPQPPPPPPSLSTPLMAVTKNGGPEVPPPPIPPSANLEKRSPSPGPPPPPPPTPLKKISPGPPPPPPPKATGSAASSKLSAVPKGKQPGEGEPGMSSRGEGANGNNGQVKLKPLHWDKVKKNTNHSMVWDKIDGGSFRFDDDLMEALFGYVASNRRSPKNEITQKTNSPLAQIVILDPRKSQNIAIVIKSLAISRKEILEALTDGFGLDVETLEKLIRIALTKEEETQILEFSGDPTRLADAESFMYHLLKAVPSAFSRFNAMLFRSTYDTEVHQFKDCLETLELGCKELRSRGLFVKLLEAILKAGNRMNAGTARGNAQAFKLSSLKKLSDVKSTDGKTTLLHFVVEEVVRSEGKRLILNRNRSFGSSSSSRSSDNSAISNSAAAASKEERDREYKMLGLPVVGGLSSEFSSVKKAAQIDYDTIASTCLSLAARVREIKVLVAKSATSGDGGEGFVREMKGFLKKAEEELNVLKEEQKRVMELVKKTTDYYQAGSSNDHETHQLQMFVIVKDFLGMVDQVCVEIARNLQRKKTRGASGSGSSPSSLASKVPVRFPNLPASFFEEAAKSSSSDSDSEA